MADYGRFRYRHVDHAHLAELLEKPFGRLERAAVFADILAKHDDGPVALHLLFHRKADRLDHCRFGHVSGFLVFSEDVLERALARGILALGREAHGFVEDLGYLINHFLFCGVS